MAMLHVNKGRVDETILSQGSDEIYYDEGGGGASQGNPAAGLLFALSTKQLPKLTQVEGVSQKWFVDDGHGFATGNDKIRKLRQTWSKLTDAGDKFDFRTQNRKCAIVVC